MELNIDLNLFRNHQIKGIKLDHDHDRRQSQEERHLIGQGYPACRQLSKSGFNPLIDLGRFKTDLDHRFLSGNVMEALGCAIENLVQVDKPTLQEWFQNSHGIGAKSVFGVALATDLRSIPSALVIKAPQEPHVNLVHEAFVGLFCLNYLRRYIPNFAFILGYFRCAPPLLNPADRSVSAWCYQSRTQVDYVIYENINPSVSIYDFIRTTSLSKAELIEIVTQVLGALDLAYHLFKYTHYDLHMNNMLVSTLSNPIKINYRLGSVTSKYLVTIIDYGFNRVELGGRVYHLSDSRFTRPFILQDAYSLITGMAYILVTKNDPIAIEWIGGLLAYFVTRWRDPRVWLDDHKTYARISLKDLPRVAVLENRDLTDLFKLLPLQDGKLILQSEPIDREFSRLYNQQQTVTSALDYLASKKKVRIDLRGLILAEGEKIKEYYRITQQPIDRRTTVEKYADQVTKVYSAYQQLKAHYNALMEVITDFKVEKLREKYSHGKEELEQIRNAVKNELDYLRSVIGRMPKQQEYQQYLQMEI